jgi:protein O-GlcNAc transferase
MGGLKKLKKKIAGQARGETQAEVVAHAADLLGRGRGGEALASLTKAASKTPLRPGTHHLLGLCHLQAGDSGKGIASLRQALRLAPKSGAILNHLGVALYQAGETAEGLTHLRQAVTVAPGMGEARNNLAHALNESGDYAGAAVEYRVVVQLAPTLLPAWQGLLSSLHKSGELAVALDVARDAVTRFPGQSTLFASLGRILMDLRQPADAEQALRQALALDPKNGEAANNLGTLVEEQNRLAEAMTLYEQATRHAPRLADGWFNLGTIREKAGDLIGSRDSLAASVALRPQSARHLSALIAVRRKLCDWPGLDEQVERLRTLIARPDFLDHPEDAPSPFSVLSLMLDSAEHLRVAKAHSLTIERKAAAWREEVGPWQRPPTRPDGPIRIGYLSPDFREHPIAQLIAGVIEQHDRSRFEISCWSLGVDDGSSYRSRIIEAADRFVDLHQVDTAHAVRLMRQARLDIVIDLAGYTAHARPELLALRVAPLQINYLGYPGTMGASFIDYIIIDDVLAGPEDEQYYSEKILRLPGCYQANDDKTSIDPESVCRADHGLPEDVFVFCSFSMNYKIDKPVFDVWCEILHRVPRSVLWLFRTDAAAAENLQAEAAKRGIPRERLIFADRLPKAKHLARHRLADLFLDTFAYGAHTTASDALWAGLPVLTLRGDTFARRVGASIVRAAGMGELAAETVDGYIAQAVDIAATPGMAENLKAILNSHVAQCSLFATDMMVKRLEVCYLLSALRGE